MSHDRIRRWLAKAEGKHPATQGQDLSKLRGDVSRMALGSLDDGMPGKHDTPEDRILTPAAETTAHHLDNVAQLREMVIGHRAGLIRGGFHPDVADEMAQQLHELLAPEFVL